MLPYCAYTAGTLCTSDYAQPKKKRWAIPNGFYLHTSRYLVTLLGVGVSKLSKSIGRTRQGAYFARMDAARVNGQVLGCNMSFICNPLLVTSMQRKEVYLGESCWPCGPHACSGFPPSQRSIFSVPPASPSGLTVVLQLDLGSPPPVTDITTYHQLPRHEPSR